MTDDLIVRPFPTRHPQVRITLGERTALVDEGIAELILELWRADITTVMSCQENSFGRVFVDFPGETDLLEFLTIVRNEGADEEEVDLEDLDNRIEPTWVPDDDGDFLEERAWELRAMVKNWAADEEYGSGTGRPPEYQLFISVQFLCSDYEEVLARVRRANERRHR